MLKIDWYIKRLKVMSWKEISYRVYEQIHVFYLQIQYYLGIGVSSEIIFDPNKFIFIRSNLSCLPALIWLPFSDHEKEKMLNGEFKGLGDELQWRGDDGIWFLSSKGQLPWPKRFFKSIDYRQGNIYGDVRVSWELSRLQQLVNAALLVDIVDMQSSEKLVILIEEQLNSWVKSNPPLCGVHYISSMECALRIVSVCTAVDLIRNRLNKAEQTWGNVLKLVRSHALIIENRISLYSSAGNHTIAECVGLIFAGVLFPEFKGAKRWKSKGEKILLSEIPRQIYKDGGGVEQTLWYYVFIIDLLGLVIKLYEHYQIDIDNNVINIYHKGRVFINVFATSLDELPNIGDSDNGYALSKFLNITWEESLQKEGLTVFNESGYSVYNNSARAQQVVFDHGVLGMMPSCGHGHSDALSILVKSNNSPILIDSGTFTYTGDLTFREYFRSTRAHNTIVVNQLDQAVQEGPFLWSKAYSSSLIHHEVLRNGEISLVAMHDGYSHLGVIHWRGIQILTTGNILVIDMLTGEGEHDIELNWHLGTNVASIQSNEIFLGKEMIKVFGGEVLLYSGELAPVNGWYSPAYGVKEKSHVINVKYQGGLPHEFITEINLSGEFTADSVVEEKVSVIRHVIDDYR